MTITIEDFMKTATDEQKDLLFKIGETTKQEKKFADIIRGFAFAEEIRRIHGPMKSGVYFPDGYNITLCEDEDGAVVISIDPLQELERVRELMGTYMKEAVKLEMGNLEIIQRNYELYV